MMLKTHAVYIALIVLLLIFGRVWLSEHDARVKAEQTVKQQQDKVQVLQEQIKAIPVQTAAKVQVVTRVVHDAQTPAQVVAAIPQLTDVPLQARVSPINPADVEVAAQPLIQVLGELKTAQVELSACQQVDGLKDQQLAAKDTEIVALKKKPKLLERVKHVAEAVGVGIAVGFVLAAKL